MKILKSVSIIKLFRTVPRPVRLFVIGTIGSFLVAYASAFALGQENKTTSPTSTSNTASCTGLCDPTASSPVVTPTPSPTPNQSYTTPTFVPPSLPNTFTYTPPSYPTPTPYAPPSCETALEAEYRNAYESQVQQNDEWGSEQDQSLEAQLGIYGADNSSALEEGEASIAQQVGEKNYQAKESLNSELIAINCPIT